MCESEREKKKERQRWRGQIADVAHTTMPRISIEGKIHDHWRKRRAENEYTLHIFYHH